MENHIREKVEKDTTYVWYKVVLNWAVPPATESGQKIDLET